MAVASPYILARTMKEAHDFARETLGLRYGRYRIVNSPSTIKSVRNAPLFLVPGHAARFDRFAMKGAIRWTRMQVIDVEADGIPAEYLPQPETPEAPPAAPDGLNPPGVQMSFDELFSEVGNGNQMISEGGPVNDPTTYADDGVDIAAPEPEAVEAEAEAKVEEKADEATPAPKARRRRRCKECGVLVEPDDVEAHKAQHEEE